MPNSDTSADVIAEVAAMAWATREHARTIGGTKVGCALRAKSGRIYSGCNVEHRFRSHDVHAEVNAISTMVANGESGIDLIVIVAERDFFTPCGACMDWIMEFGSPSTRVAFQASKRGEVVQFTAHELMPHYPR